MKIRVVALTSVIIQAKLTYPEISENLNPSKIKISWL